MENKAEVPRQAGSPADGGGGRARLTRVALRDYRGIAACDVPLAQLSFLVGLNGTGKSSFVDALRFVSDAVRSSIDCALRDRGGIDRVRRRPGRHVGVSLDLDLGESTARYAFVVAPCPRGGYEVRREQCVVRAGDGSARGYYEVRAGRVVGSSLRAVPEVSTRCLRLAAVSGAAALFRPVRDALAGMGFCRPAPDAIRRLQVPGPGDLLRRDGSNAASVLARLGPRSRGRQMIERYIGLIVPGVTGVSRRSVGHLETIVFHREAAAPGDPRQFFADSASDGTLRALGVLVALFQGDSSSGASPTLIGVEGPETGLHPAASGALLDSLRDGAQRAQVLVTTHSPDLLDDKDISGTSILAAVRRGGENLIAPAAGVCRSALQDRLFTAGELLRMNQLDAPTVFSLKPPAETDERYADG